MATWSVVKVSELEGTIRLDAEYYRPEYLQASRAVEGHERLQKLSEKILHPKEIQRVYADSDTGMTFLLAQNIQRGRLDFSTKAFISAETARAIARSRLEIGDVVMTRTGANYGDAACYLGVPSSVYASAHCLVIRPKNVSGPYLSVYLSSRIGRMLVKRGMYGSSQPEIAPEYLRTLSIPRPGNDAENRVEDLVRQSLHHEQQSEALYFQAEKMVLEEIGWRKLDISQPKWWAIPLSREREVKRIDAEHFQPKYDKLVNHLKRTGKAKQLREVLREPIQKGVTPEYDPEGAVAVVNSQHLGRYCLNFEGADRTTETFWKANSRAQIRGNDVMIYATGAYIGRTNAYLEAARAVAGVDMLLVRPADECNPVYLAMFLNASPGLMQSKRFASGSGQAHIYAGDVSRYWVYIPTNEFQQNVAHLIQESYRARQKAHALLDKAKHEVEALIEGS